MKMLAHLSPSAVFTPLYLAISSFTFTTLTVNRHQANHLIPVNKMHETHSSHNVQVPIHMADSRFNNRSSSLTLLSPQFARQTQTINRYFSPYHLPPYRTLPFTYRNPSVANPPISMGTSDASTSCLHNILINFEDCPSSTRGSRTSHTSTITTLQKC